MKRTLLIAVSVLALACASCDLFRTRDPQSPTQGSSNYETPTTYDKVLRNLVFAVNDKNVANYMSCFVDTAFRPFVYAAAEDARRSYPDVMAAWNLEAEQRAFINMREATPGAPALVIPDRPPIYVSSDSVVYDLDYTLLVPHQRAAVPKLVRGTMRLSIGTDGKRWSIYQWRDTKTAADSTWSYLKAAFSGS